MQLNNIEDVLRTLHSPHASVEKADELSSWLDKHWFEFIVRCSDLTICSNVPALLAPLGERLTIPAEMQEMLNAISDANGERNVRLLQEYDLIKQTLKSADIHPAPLKGIATLEQNIYPEINQRIVSDIDLVITPSELPAAIHALREADYCQAANQYDSENLKNGAAFLPIDETDFRNLIDYVECHVPRIIRPGQFDTLELHAHATNRTSILSPWLDQHASKNDSLFHLVHNFEHTHRKDGWALRGMLDWRHLTDAAMRLKLDNSGNLPEAMMQVASDHELDDEMAVHLYQLQQYLGVPNLSDLIAHPRYSCAIDTFERRHASRRWRRAAMFADKLKLGVRGIFSPRVLHERYGPMPLPMALLMSVRFYGTRVVHGDLIKDV